MKLSELLSYRQQLQQHRPADADALLHHHLAPLLHFVINHELQFAQQRYQLEQAHARAVNELRTFDTVIKQMIDHVNDAIQKRHNEYFARSYQLYSQQIINEKSDWILNRRPALVDDRQKWLLAKVQARSDWTHPGLIIRPGREDWITHLVALDPLYLADQRHDLLAPAIERFNPKYQRRLRPYIITETETGVESLLPSHQIGYALVYNFFAYKPFEIVRFYLQELWRVLVPGGIVHFTFNDCDRPGGVDLVEKNFTCYQPGSMVLAAAENQGFQIQQVEEVDAATTWVEMAKPGERHVIRGGQTLATLVDKSQKNK